MLCLKNIVRSLSNFNASRVFLSTTALPKEEKVIIGKYAISYIKVGNGPHHIFCAPGALGTKWTDLKPIIEGFNHDKFSIVAWDPPGYGKSYPPKREFVHNFLEIDADLAHELMKVLDIPKYSVLGFSDGGIASLILSAKYPDKVNKLVVWGANSFILPTEQEAYNRIKDVNKWSKRVSDEMIKIYGKTRFANYWSSWVEAMDELCKTRDGNICSEFIKNIKCPTFILYGEKDPLVDRVHISHLHTQINGSRIHLYPEGKHHIHLQYAEDFNKRVQDFLLQ